LTRRTVRFDELARLVERYCALLGLDIPAPIIDQVLNDRIEEYAEARNMSQGTVLSQASDQLAASIARSLALTSEAMSDHPRRPGGHLRGL
jgi:hypothetical protein